MFEAVAEQAKTLIKPFKTLPLEKPFNRNGKNTIQEHLVMHLSDEHADQTVKAHQVGGFEEYNFRIALSRAEYYVKTILKFTQESLSNYRFKNLTILSYGDHTSGEIHGSVGRSYFRNQFRNCLAIGQMQALMVRDLAPYFESVNVLCLPGNHGRRSVKKDFNGPWDNWDYLVSEVAASYCSNLPNVGFLIPDAFSANICIEGYWFHGFHGDDIQSFNSIPFYGIERKTRRLVALNAVQQKRIHAFFMGHFHKCSTLGDLDGEIIINGAWLATDPFVYNSLSGFSEPRQWIHGVHEAHGITWRLPVRLRSKNETSIFTRYKPVMSDVLGNRKVCIE